MKKLFVLMTAVITTCGAITGCTKDDQITPGESSDKGYVSGKVTDTQGNPLPGASITVEHTVWFDSYATGVSDASGNYKIMVPADPAGSWTIKAQIEKDAYGVHYTCDLESNDTAKFYAKDATQRNFTWKLSGQKVNGNFYGAHADIYQLGADVNMDEVTLRFTPLEAQLLDGSSAQVIEKKLQDVAGTFMVNDIPIGKYKVKAAYPGKTLLLQNRNKEDQPGEEKEVVFGKNGYLGETEYNIGFWLSE